MDNLKEKSVAITLLGSNFRNLMGWRFGFLFFIGTFSLHIFAKEDVSIKNGNLKETEAPSERPMNSLESQEQFKRGYDLYSSGSFEKAIQNFQINLKKGGGLLETYNNYYLAMSYKKLAMRTEAEKAFQTVLKRSPNMKMINEVKMNLGELSLETKNYKNAKKYFDSLEKRTRYTEIYPDVLYSLAILEKGLKNQRNLCKWLLKIYTQYPEYSKVKNWSEEFEKDKFEGMPHGCNATMEDFKIRLRNLIWSGLENQAQEEMNKVKDRIGKEDPFLLDSIHAQFFIQEGEIVKAYEILKPHFPSKKGDVAFLQSFGALAARAGNGKEGVEAYKLAFQIAGHSKEGLHALYQAAFMSYQTMDYDGARALFSDYLKRNSQGQQAGEAQWLLGWIQYLKGDYNSSLNTLLTLIDRKNRKILAKGSLSKDRILFWIGMNLMRLKKMDKAKIVFSNLAKDKLQGYYSIAAQYRLKKISKSTVPIGFRNISDLLPNGERFLVSENMMPSLDSGIVNPHFDKGGGINSFYSYSSLNLDSDDGFEDEKDEATGLEANAEAKSLGLEETENTQELKFKNEQLEQSLQRARELIKIGLGEWARWELFDIERKTRAKDHLKLLMREYSSIQNFHRSSYISQTVFAGPRGSQSMESTKSLWEYAYPRAYSEHVEKYSKEFEVSSAFIWSIMRTESQFRKEAISPVGALGLMQVMPVTGYRVARILHDSEFRPEDLLKPEISVKIGTRYLKRLLKQFDGLIPLVAAGYNAGPHRVFNWLSAFGKLDTDEFIEHIPFVETRNYVKKVVSSCHIYSRLYEQKEELVGYLSDSVPFKSNIVGGFRENWDDL